LPNRHDRPPDRKPQQRIIVIRTSWTRNQACPDTWGYFVYAQACSQKPGTRTTNARCHERSARPKPRFVWRRYGNRRSDSPG
jgi:hypothetical protein